MSITNPEHTKTTWSSLFNRKGAAGIHTRLFEDFDLVTQKSFIERVCLREDELPVLASTPADEPGFLLTTTRLFFFTRKLSETIDTTSIENVLPAELGQTRKDEMTLLKVRLYSGRELQVEVETGPPFFGVWNVLRNAAARNKSVDRLR